MGFTVRSNKMWPIIRMEPQMAQTLLERAGQEKLQQAGRVSSHLNREGDQEALRWLIQHQAITVTKYFFLKSTHYKTFGTAIQGLLRDPFSRPLWYHLVSLTVIKMPDLLRSNISQPFVTKEKIKNMYKINLYHKQHMICADVTGLTRESNITIPSMWQLKHFHKSLKKE